MFLPARRSLFLCLTAVSSWGCAGLEQARFNDGVGLSRDVTLIVPFSEPGKYRFYGESKRGNFLAESLKSWAISHWNIEFLDGPEVRAVLRQARDWPQDRIGAKNWQELTRGLGVKYILVGEIQDLALADPRQIGIVSASIKAAYRVVNGETGRVAYRNTRTIQYGNYGALDDHELPRIDLGPMEEGDKGVERRLLLKASEEIGKELYGYYRD